MNQTSLSSLITRASESLTNLAGNPWALFAVLLAINALAQPYAGITHDSRLYSGQVLNRVENGAYADDLFFRYGSQDDYSLFSRLAAPVVQLLGIHTAFFMLFVLGKSLLIFGMLRIVNALVPNPFAATLALFYCMAVPINYGGHHVLFVQENFVTPRMFACGFVLLGLDALLRDRPVMSLLAIVAAIGLHPLMAFGGLLVWTGYHAWKHLGVYAFLGLAGSAIAAAAVVLAVESIGKRVFGAMDAEWREAIMQASPFNFPSLWDRADWLGLAFQLVILGVMIWRYWSVDAEKARLLTVLAIVTIAGAVGAVLAEQLPYALLLQGQPYRALWMASFLHLAFVVELALEHAAQAISKDALACAACSGGLLAYLCCIDGLAQEFALPVLLWPLLAVILRGLGKEPNHADWLIQSVQAALILGGVGWGLYKFALLARGYGDLVNRHAEVRDAVEIMIRNLGPIVFGIAAVALTWFLASRGELPGVTMALAGGGIFLASHGFWFAFPETDFYRERCTEYRADIQQARAVLTKSRDADAPLPTVYCNLACLDYVWIDLHAKSYFDWWQAGNYMFRREMAMEGKRRAALVGPAALAGYRRFEHQLSPGYKEAIGRFYQTDFDRPLTRDDIIRLCCEPGLDYLVLDRPVDGVAAIQVGRLFVYVCADLRQAASRNDG